MKRLILMVLAWLALVQSAQSQEMIWPVPSKPLARVDLLGIMDEPASISFYQQDQTLRSSYNGQVWVGPDKLGIKYWLTDNPKSEFALYAQVDDLLLCLNGTGETCNFGPIACPYIPDLVYYSLTANAGLNYTEAWTWRDIFDRNSYAIQDIQTRYWILIIPDQPGFTADLLRQRIDP